MHQILRHRRQAMRSVPATLSLLSSWRMLPTACGFSGDETHAMRPGSMLDSIMTHFDTLSNKECGFEAKYSPVHLELWPESFG